MTRRFWSLRSDGPPRLIGLLFLLLSLTGWPADPSATATLGLGLITMPVLRGLWNIEL